MVAMNDKRRVWGYRLLGGELEGLPKAAHARFAALWRELGARDVAPDDVWWLDGHCLLIYVHSSGGRVQRMAVEMMAEDWLMVWAHGPASVFRRRLLRRLAQLG
jgi:hypothetical protein